MAVVLAENGRYYSFGGLDIGTQYAITPTKSGCGFSPQVGTGTIDGDTIVNFTTDCILHKISGTVLEDGIEWLSGVIMNGGALGTTITDYYGNYEFSGIPQGSEYTITPQKTGMSTA